MVNSLSVGSSGYVVDTFVAVMWCLLTTDNYRDCVLKAVNLGSDTDTTAAVAGELAGIIFFAPIIAIPPPCGYSIIEKPHKNRYND